MKIPVSVTKTAFRNTLPSTYKVSIPTTLKVQDIITSEPKTAGINTNLNTDLKRSISTNQILLIMALISIIGITLYAVNKKIQKENHESDNFN